MRIKTFYMPDIDQTGILLLSGMDEKMAQDFIRQFNEFIKLQYSGKLSFLIHDESDVEFYPMELDKPE